MMRKILEAVAAGRLTPEEAERQMASHRIAELGFATVDLERQARRGRPEVIYAEGKTPEQVVAIARSMQAAGQNVLMTRLNDGHFAAITEASQPLVEQGAELWCEPGRAMVAAGGAMLVRVTLRKGRRLYINDGTYGSLFDAGALNWRFPVRLVRPMSRLGKNSNAPNTRTPSEKLVGFTFYGPTCDNLDKMKGPFLLPEDTQEGDWIEIGQLGSYGATMRTNFNGFFSDETVEVADKPIMSIFGIN